MKILIILIVVFCFLKVYGQKDVKLQILNSNIVFQTNKVYIVSRGTKRKASLIAQKFNIQDKYSSHVGIGFSNGKNLTIYNVTDNFNSSESAFVVDSLESFVSGDDVFYVSIWAIESRKGEVQRLIDICDSYSHRKIVFDASFTISNNDTLYCSEFCSRVLYLTNKRKFHFKPETICLNNKLYEQILGRSTITYFPVDFFQKNKNFEKVFEYKFIQ